MNRLGQVLKIRPGEGSKVALLVGLMLFTSAGGSIGGNGIEALFFSRFGVQYLPYMYMALGAVTFLTSLGITALLGRVARERLYLALSLILSLILIAERILIAFDLNWFYPVLWLGMNVKGSLQGLLTWGLAGAVCDTRQAKRLFPLFGAGGILGAVVGGLGTRPLVGWLHTENLLLVWAAALLIAFALSRALIGRAPARRTVTRKKRTRLIDDLGQGYHTIRRSSLMRWMSGSVVLFAVLFFSLAFPFSKAAAARFPDEDALAGFLGLFQGLSTGAAFLASLFLTNRLFARFGLMSTIMALPALYLAGFGLLAIYAAFPMLVLFRFVQQTWISGVAGTAYQAVFNIIPPERRDQTRAFMDGVPGQAGLVIAGLILVIGEQALQPRQLYFIGLGTAALTLVLVWRASRAYGGALVEALRAGQPHLFFSEEEPFGGFQRDAAAVSAAVAGVSNPDPVVRRVSAEILGQLSAPEATRALVGALKDSDLQVRAASLRALARARALSALLDVAARLNDPEPDVRLAAVEALRGLAGYPEGLASHIRPLLNDADAAVRARAAAALLRLGPESQARDLLRHMAVTGTVEARLSALNALGDWGDAEAFELVAVELEDMGAPAAVRRAAVSALMRINGGGARAVGPLVQALGDKDRSVQESAAKALGPIGAPALDRVIAALSTPGLEHGALRALEHFPSLPVPTPVRDYARDRASRALRYHELSRVVASETPAQSDDGMQLLADSLRAKAVQDAISALQAVALLGDRDSISLAIDNLKSRDPGQRANALETLDASREKHIVRPLLSVWETGEAAPAESVDSRWLPAVLQDSDDWLRACAALVARGSDDPQVRSGLAQLAQSDADATVRETAEASLKGTPTMDTLSTLSLMERILFLRRVPLFADLVPADLKQVAAIAAERLYPDGEVIAHQNEPGDEMYIIVSGEVRVMAGAGEGMEVARRKPGEYVGEMAILSQKPRMASLVASGDVRLLCIEQAQFEGILRERPETSLAVIQVLCARLESATTPRSSTVQ